MAAINPPRPIDRPPDSPPLRRLRRSSGTVLGALAAIIALVFATGVSAAGAVGGQGGAVQSTDTAQSAGDRQEEPDDEKSPGIGDPVRDGKFEFTVTKVRSGVDSVGADVLREDAEGQFVLVYLTVENIGDESQLFDGSAQKAFDAKDREFSSDTGAAIVLEESKSFLNEINPGNTVEGIVVFDVPKDVKLVKMELHDSFLSDGVTVELKRN